MRRNKPPTVSISLRLEGITGTPSGELIEFVRSGSTSRHSPVPSAWGERVTLALDSFWLPHALHAKGDIDEITLLSATFGCIEQLKRQISKIAQTFEIAEDEQEEYNQSVFTPFEYPSDDGKLLRVTYRFQPYASSKLALLLDWVKSPSTVVMHSMTERVVIALEAFWLPFALRHFQRTDEEVHAAAISSIAQLNQRISELRDTFLNASQRYEDHVASDSDEEPFDYPSHEVYEDPSEREMDDLISNF